MFSWLLSRLAPALVVMGVTLIICLVRYPVLPDPIPIHFGPLGEPDRWAAKNPLTVGIPILLQAAMVVTFGIILAVLARQLEHAGRSLGNGIARGAVWVNLLLLVVGLKPWMIPIPHWAWLLSVTLLGVIGSIDMIYRAVQESGDISGQSASGHGKLGGILYYNPEDTRMLVPRRWGVGVTLNFAHKGSWLFLGALLLPPLAVLLLILVVAGAGTTSVP